MKEEFTEKQHSEFSISRQDEIYLAAANVWSNIPFDASDNEIKEEAEWYGISFEQALSYREHFKKMYEE